MKYGDALEVFRDAGPYGVAELAARAGISRPTLYRLFSGAVPRADDLQELALAAGWELQIDLAALSDPLAAVAGRALLGDDTVAEWAEAAEAWRERITRFAGARQGRQREAAIVDEAGRASAPGKRPGAVRLRGEHWRVDRLVSAGRASEQRWALSGWAALDALGIDAQAPTIMWVEDARKVGQLLGDSFRPAHRDDADLIVAYAHLSVFAGATAVQDVELVSPLQAFIDAAGLGGDARLQALIEFGRTS
ncbi:helix-turn-helix domain-containing protein [Curtobacterium sp. SP.BCp]|uniref:helix-turn-helix domain-containing protein n=1 Tax=Curtobacterium sp. SP.BCp TaxID=3435230 RepID=UPI003F7340C3